MLFETVVYFKDCVGLLLLVIYWLFFFKTVLLMQCFKFQPHNTVLSWLY
jgi:hypothetical protein